MRLRRTPANAVADRRVVWQAASLLLAYPDEAFSPRLQLVAAAVDGLPVAVREPLLDCIRRLSALDPVPAAVLYVDTFDWRRRRTMFLTYYTAGDTRGRGVALLEFAQAYRAAGVAPPEGELPDHLAVVLEFAATVDEDAGYRLLAGHRTSIDLLLDGLRRMDSPYALALQAVVDTLPPAGQQDLVAARRIAMQGPPAEAVGLNPYPLPGPGAGPVDIALIQNPRVPSGKAFS